MPRVEYDRCNPLGHRADKCIIKKDVNAVNGSDAKPNLYERSVLINGHKIPGLIDTGSSCTLLRASVVKTYNIVASVTSDNVLRGFAGQSTTSNRLAPCEVKIMDTKAQVNAHVVPDNHLTYDVGRDFLAQDDIVVIKRGKDLIFKQLPAMNDKSENIIDINFFDIDVTGGDITKYTADIKEEARQQCTELLQRFGIASRFR